VKRRLLLKGAAGAALATPFLSSLQKPARAQAVPAPRRLVIFHTSNGCLTNRWFPTVEHGAIDPTALKGTTLEPLSPFASKLLFPRGLAMYPWGTELGYFDPTDQSMGSKLTAAPIDSMSPHYALGRSLDHVLAEAVNPAQNGPLVLSVGTPFTSSKTILSYSAPREPVTPLTDPVAVYASLTGLLGGGAPSEADYRVRRGESILDAVRDDLATYQRLDLSQNDRQKIEAWLDLLRETEQQVMPLACNADSIEKLGITTGALEAASATDNATAFTLGGDMLLKLIALTLMCDANRSILLSWPAYVTFTWDGMAHQNDHNGLSHRNGSAAVGGTCIDGVLGMLRQIDEWYAGRYAKLVGLLDGIVEGERTLLDNCAVMWLPQLSDGNASNVNNLPIVIAGSSGGYLRQGVSVNLEGGTLGTGNSEACCNFPGDAITFDTGSSTGHVPLNKLYVTLLNAVGATNEGQAFREFGQVDTNDLDAGITDPGELVPLRA
jgi:hypothetical protein